MRLTLVIPALGVGGAERVMVTLSNAWARRGWEVTLLTYDDGAEQPFFPLDPAVNWLPLGIRGDSTNVFHGLQQNLQRLWRLRQAITRSKPDVVISFLDQTNVMVLAATTQLGVPALVSERNDPAYQPLGRAWQLLRRCLYPRASSVVVQTAAAKRYFPPAVQRRTRIIPNPVVAERVDTRDIAMAPADAEFCLVAAGRLTEQKGFDLLLCAFAEIAVRHPSWSLTIWGEGPLRGQLTAQRDAFGLASRVALPGRTSRLPQALTRADLFVLSSRYEGFPNILCEAMAQGLPVVSFDCPSGPSEILRPGIDGLLVPRDDVAALAAALDRLMGDDEQRRALAKRSPEIVNRFGLDRILAEWDTLLSEVHP